MITNEKYFFKNQSSVSTSGPLYNVNDGTLILQVDGNVSNLELLVLGNTDLIDDNFVTLKTINASNYNMSDKITSTGIYWIDINGIRKIKLNLNKITGSVSVKAITKRGLTTDLVARAMAANSASSGITLDDVEAITGELVNLNTEDKSNLVNAINEVANKGSDVEGNELAIYSLKLNGLASGNNVKSSDLPKIDEMINSLFQKGVKQFILRLTYDDSIGYSNAPYTEFIGYNNSWQIKEDQSAVILYSLSNEDVSNGSIRVNRTFNIYGSWNNGVFETSRARFYSGTTYDLSRFLTSSTALTKDNTIQYTPTSDYNPATKKYVDDQITMVNDKTLYLEGTGLIFGSGLNTAENKQLLTDTINKNIGSYFNVIVRDSDSVLTWTYSFDTLPQTTSSYIRTLAPYYTMTVARTTVYIGDMQINYTYDADKGLYNITQWAMVNRKQLSITDQNEYISGTKTFTTLPKTTLVPTTDDQFVNKKYVDDQVGNINTILATLTTVSEVSK